MSLTLVEAAKMAADDGNALLSGVIELFASSSDLINSMGFSDIAGGALAYNREEELPGIGFRGVNEAFSESTGIINPVVETLHIIGGDMDFDNFILKTQGSERRETEEAMKIKAASLRMTKALIKGDNTSDPREVSGLQSRITGDQLVSAGSTSGGAALTLDKVDELIDLVDEPTHLLMSKAVRRKFTAASRNTGIGGFITFEQDNLGRRQAFYGELPILISDTDELNVKILDFNEAASSGPSTATSLYCLSLTDDGVDGIQNGTLDARDLGELQTKSAQRLRVEWFAGMAIFRGTAAARLQHIGDLDIV